MRRGFGLVWPSLLSPQSKVSIVLYLCFIHFVSAQGLIVIYPDIEQGSATLIVSPIGEAVVIDAGTEIRPTDVDIVSFLRTLENRRIFTELVAVISTHYDEDHIGSMDRVLGSGVMSSNGLVYDRGDSLAPSTQAYADYVRSTAAYRRVQIILGQVITLGGGVTLECIAVNGNLKDGRRVDVLASPQLENSLCIALKVKYGDFDLWIGGDLTGNSQNGFPDVETPAGLLAGDVDVYTVNHHGSENTSSVQSFLNHLRAEIAICQNGIDNTFGHPHRFVVQRILSSSSARIPQFFGCNPGPPNDSRVNNSLATGFADPDGQGGIPGHIYIASDGKKFVVAGEAFPR